MAARNWAALPFVLMLAGPDGVQAQGITQRQAEQILNELKAIRVALERQQGPVQPRVPSVERIVELDAFRGPSLGRQDAPLTLVEYSDLECSYCRQFFSTVLGRLKSAYIDTGALRFVHRDFPLAIHAQALAAARASRCAADQGRFWELRTGLLSGSPRLSETAIRDLASGLSVDMDAYDACMRSDSSDQKIKQDVDEARGLGVQGTPTFVLGRTIGTSVKGELLAGGRPFEVFDAKIRSLLAGTPSSVK